LIVKGGAKVGRGRDPSTHRGWRAVGWFGLLLAAVGFGDLALYLYPPNFGVPEWEFATLTQVFSSLPLGTIGLAGVVGAALVDRGRRRMIVIAVVLLLLSSAIGLGYLVFLLNLPLALQAATGPQGPAIYRTIARGTIMAGGFGIAYLVAGIVLLRSLPERESA
jgi:hypothetical protein